MLQRLLKLIKPVNEDEDVAVPLQTTRELEVEECASTSTSSPHVCIPMEILTSDDNVTQPQEQNVQENNVAHSEENQNANNDNTIAVISYNPNHRNRIKSFNGFSSQHRSRTEGFLTRLNQRAMSLPPEGDVFMNVCLWRRLNEQLFKAINDFNDAEVERLLDVGASPNARTCRVITIVSACHIAALNDNGIALKLLLKHKADKNIRDDYGFAPLHYAAFKGNNWAVAILLGIPNDLQKACIQFSSGIEEEIEKLRPQIDIKTIEVRNDSSNVKPDFWRMLADDELNIITDLPWRQHWTPLHIASYEAQCTTVRLLLAAGADPNSQDLKNCAPLNVAGGSYLEPRNQNISIVNYEKTIKALIEYGGMPNQKLFLKESILHTAVAMGSVNAVRELLAIGVPIDTHNAEGDTPLHKCVSKHYEEPLKVLAYRTIPGSTYKAVNLTDRSGNTVLHAAILASWLPGVRIALDAGGNVFHQNENGYTAIHLAARKGNVVILKEVLVSAKYKLTTARFKDAVNIAYGFVESPLLCAIRSRNVECIRMILKSGASLKVTYYIEPGNELYTHLYLLYRNYKSKFQTEEENEFNMIVHATVEIGSADILEYLMIECPELKKLCYYRCKCLMNTTPIELAAFYNHFDMFVYLLARETVSKYFGTHPSEKSRLLDIITCLGRDNMYYKLMLVHPDALRIAAKNGHYPLHNAIKYGSKEVILHMIDNGADLSQTDGFGDTAFTLITEHIPKPTEFIEEIFTRCIKTNKKPIQNRGCEITVDYLVLMPPEAPQTNKGDIRVLKALLEHDRKNQRELLAHPLVESFVELKWKSLATYFYIMVSFYILFVILLSGYIVIVCYYKDNKERLSIPAYFNPYGWQFTMYFVLFVILVQELIGFNQSLKSWTLRIYSVEFFTKCFTYISAIITPWILTVETEDSELQRFFATLTLVLAWLIIMMLLLKTPIPGYYIQMFWNVSKTILKILTSFLFLIIMFSFCFMIQFHSKIPFDWPVSAILKTLVMMTSEFDYENHFSKADNTFTLLVLQVIFILFLIFCAIVLMNLMVGVAVDDVKHLVHDGNLRRMEKQVDFLNKLEVSRGKKSFYHKFKLYRWFNYKEVPEVVKIKPVNDGRCCFSERIKELIITKAQKNFEDMKTETDLLSKETNLNKTLEATTVQKPNLTNAELKLNNISETLTQKEEVIKKENLEANTINEQNLLKIESKLDQILQVQAYTKKEQSKIKNSRNWTRSYKRLRQRNKLYYY